MNDLKFYCRYIIVNENQICDVDLTKFLNQESVSLKHKGTINLAEIIKKDNYICITIEYGTTMPRPDHVINYETDENEENPRQPGQIEPKQMFAMIDIDNSCIWASSLKKISIIETLFTKLDYRIELKNIYNADEFISKLKTVDNIKLTSTPENLFKESCLNETLDNNVYGYGASLATLELKYKNKKRINLQAFENIKDLFRKRNSFTKFIICGRDDGNMGVVFNNETLVEKIFLDVLYNDAGQYDPEEVYDALIKRIIL